VVHISINHFVFDHLMNILLHSISCRETIPCSEDVHRIPALLRMRGVSRKESQKRGEGEDEEESLHELE
jgi:hypothetical protein